VTCLSVKHQQTVAAVHSNAHYQNVEFAVTGSVHGRNWVGWQVLPLLTLYQFWSTNVCRDVQWSVECRVTRLRALTDAGLLADAIRVLHGLMIGDRLPQPLSADFRPTEPSAEPTISFNTALPPVEETNMMVGLCTVR